MSTFDMLRLGFFTGFWAFLFQLAVGLLYVSTKKAMRQLEMARKIKSGQVRCEEFFHCHCEKIGKHDKHVNETNEVVWK